MNRFFYDTPIGVLGIEEKDAFIVKIFFSNEDERQREAENDGLCESKVIKEAADQLYEYFDGKRKQFTFPLRLEGTPFQIAAWKALQNVPYGETKSYKEIAEAIGNPKACRAVGMANNRNPIVVVVPCHRIVGSSGKLTGYGGGLPIKEWLLNLEQEHEK